MTSDDTTAAGTEADAAATSSASPSQMRTFTVAEAIAAGLQEDVARAVIPSLRGGVATSTLLDVLLKTYSSGTSSGQTGGTTSGTNISFIVCIS